MDGNSTRRVVVEPGGNGVVAHIELHAVGSFADRLGLGGALSSRTPWRGGGMPLHDRRKVLMQMAVVLAGGCESCLDVEDLRIGADLFGALPSDTTAARTFHGTGAATPDSTADALAEVRSEVRSEVRRRSSAAVGTAPVVLDIDAVPVPAPPCTSGTPSTPSRARSNGRGPHQAPEAFRVSAAT